MPHPQSYRLPDYTIRQLADLAKRWGTTKTDALRRCIDRTYREETTMARRIEEPRWRATHRIEDDWGTTLVMLDEEGVAYTRDEWEQSEAADYACHKGEWLRQGQPFAGTVTPLPGRLDPRYVDSDDPRAVLVAWGGPDETLDMGGWLDDDADAFLAAVQDEARFGAGEELTHVSIERAGARE